MLRKLAVAADQAPPGVKPEDIDFSGVGDWLARTEDLPRAAEASQTRRFGAWELRLWGCGNGESIGAIWGDQSPWW